MLKKTTDASPHFFLRTVSDTAGLIQIRGELPDCIGRSLPVRYYRHLVQELYHRCEVIQEPGELLLHSTLYQPCEMLCSVHVEARLCFHGHSIPFFTDGCVWELGSGHPVGFHELTGRRFVVRKLWPLLEPRREPEWLLRTCPEWESKMKKALSRYQFYLEPNTILLYFPPLPPEMPLENVCRLHYPIKCV